MACSLKTGFSVSNSQMVSGFSSSRFKDPKVSSLPVLNTDFIGKSLVISDQNSAGNSNVKPPNHLTVKAQTSFCVSKAQRWWEKTLKPNMIEIQTPQALVDALVDAGDRLAIVDFYSPGCGGCKALHPKICQLAEMNPDAIFLKVNYEELKTMCHALHIHVLPFFRFYRGGEGRLCSFSCTNATIKKFKDALAKHGTDRCGIVPAKGLDETELERLVSAGLLSLSVNSPSTDLNEGTLMMDIVMKGKNLSPSWTIAGNKMELIEENLMLKV